MASVLLTGIAMAACGRGVATERAAIAAALPTIVVEPPVQKLALSGAASSLDDLLRTVERALADSDTARLFDLMIGEREYREIVYPSLPAAHPPINASFEAIWATHFPGAYRGLRRVLARHGGRDVRILAVRFEAPDQDFVNFTLHETSRVDIVFDGVREDDRRLFGSVIHAGGLWKVLSYPNEPDE